MISQVRAFRDRRYEYKKLNKTWGKKRAAAEKRAATAAAVGSGFACALLRAQHAAAAERHGARWE